MNTTKSANTKRLYIGNLDESINEYAIIQLFKPFGKITFIEVMVHWTGEKKGRSRGFCFLEYETKEQALEAISNLHGKTIKGKSLVVSFAHMTPEQDEAKKRGQASHHKPTTLSLLKGQRLKNASTDAKIRAIEKKLDLLKRSTLSPSASPPPASQTTTKAPSNASSKSTSKIQNRYHPY
ncbi:NAPDH-dependent diflavin reductase [Mucor velutinosus]|uniref:NAPDH-dependent diflavin reductase n=1 Tax=Mucor velutinosus TaxID=708070 RepID=A0AAN7DU04_9FUNG|nr:NAPDH-dependent diflavin reductase [Mucor velutinosus]